MFNEDSSAARFSYSLVMLLCISACGDSLNSQKGPQSGLVTGVVCIDLPTLAAAIQMPAVQGTLVSEGKCLRLERSEQVKILRTVMMPGDGKYSQFELASKGSTKKMWISSARLR